MARGGIAAHTALQAIREATVHLLRTARGRRPGWSVRVRQWRAGLPPVGVALLAALVLIVGFAVGQALVGALVAVGGVSLWLLLLLWRARPAVISAGGHDGFAGGGTAGVREPRRPTPHPPTGALALPLPGGHDADRVASG